MANVTGSVYFSPIREKSDLPAENGEKVAYGLNWLCQEHSPLGAPGWLCLLVVCLGLRS